MGYLFKSQQAVITHTDVLSISSRVCHVTHTLACTTFTTVRGEGWDSTSAALRPNAAHLPPRQTYISRVPRIVLFKLVLASCTSLPRPSKEAAPQNQARGSNGAPACNGAPVRTTVAAVAT
jgi:hypothetical protein